MPISSPLYDLASHLLGEDVGAWIRESRASGRSWRRICLQLRDLTGDRIEITEQTAKVWSLAEAAEAAEVA